MEPFLVEHSQRLVGVSSMTTRPIREYSDQYESTHFLREINKGIHLTMNGECLHEVNASDLNNVAGELNSIKTIKTESLYLCRFTTSHLKLVGR
jgi:hypothetical protein